MARQQKTVTFIARAEFKNDYRKVVYLVRSSNGVDQYETSLFDGKATSCSCPSHRPCKHMKAAENREAARPFAAQSLPTWAAKLVETGKLVKVAAEAGITAEQAQELLPIAVELRQDTKHTDKVCGFEATLNRPRRKYATEYLEKQEHKANLLAECREIKERREAEMMSAALTTNKGFQLMR